MKGFLGSSTQLRVHGLTRVGNYQPAHGPCINAPDAPDFGVALGLGPRAAARADVGLTSLKQVFA